MHKQLVLCVACFMAFAVPAAAETWVAASDGTLYDKDFVKTDTTSGMTVVRMATGGRPGQPYAAWPKSKSPIMFYAVDCANDQFMDLGMDFTGAGGLPKTWRNTEKQLDIRAGLGAVGKAVCDAAADTPKAALP